MVIVLKHNAKPEEKEIILKFLENKGLKIKEIVGEQETILGIVGTVGIDKREVEVLPGVSNVIPISKPYKLTSREFKREDTIIPIGPLKIGGNRIVSIAGPCAIESREQIIETAKMVKESGAVILRGGAFKARTSPYAFQGMGEEGLKLLKLAGETTGMPVVSEILSSGQKDLMRDYVDILQIGARNMQNFDLLKAVGALGKPVILKRGMAATIEEWLMAAEYLIAHGADNVILCERGIRTFETYTRNTLDISAIPVIKKLSHLPVIVDPSHGTGIREKVLPMALAAVAAGAHGLIIEVHPDPDFALSDGPQSLFPAQFEKLMRDVQALAPVLGREVAKLPDKTAVSFTVSNNVERESKGLKIAFQGVRGAFSEKAIYNYFHTDVIPVPCEEFNNVFDAVLKGETAFGMIPLENSLTGSIHQNFDLLLQYPDIQIVGEKKIRIVFNLITLPEADIKDIKRVYSHPQGLGQCAKFLEDFPLWEKIAYSDTAKSVEYIAELNSRENAAIASAEAAKVYGMKILKESIETNPQNYTRFAVIARSEFINKEVPNKASFVFATKDKPGALYHVLRILSEKSINMTKLESRPIHGEPWEYMFYLDVELPAIAQIFDEVQKELRSQTDKYRLLGIYKA